MMTYVAQQVNGSNVSTFEGRELDWSKWQRLTMREAIIKFWPENAGGKPEMSDFATAESVGALVKRLNAAHHPHMPYDPKDPAGKTIAALFEAVAEEHLFEPTMIYDFPRAVSPLSKKKEDEPDWVERFEVFAGGMEIGNAFSELNDPEDQLARFQDQVKARQAGDEEAMVEVDYDYVRALSYGLPPTAGYGLGVDRVTMLLTGARSIRDVILFPLLRPEKLTSATQTAEPDAEP
ncbi:MAG: amino acid--tRNA ligase-related protein, partial [Terriglobales bacterium]